MAKMPSALPPPISDDEEDEDTDESTKRTRLPKGVTLPYKDPLTGVWTLPGWDDRAVTRVARAEVFGGLLAALGRWWAPSTGGGYSELTDEAVKDRLAEWLQKQKVKTAEGKIKSFPIKSKQINELAALMHNMCFEAVKSVSVSLATKEYIPFLPMKDCLYSPTTGEKRTYTDDDFITWQLPFVASDIAASKCPRWESFIHEGFEREDDVLLIQEWFGYCLRPIADLQRCLWLYGLRASGKSVIANTLIEMLGAVNCWSGQISALGHRFNDGALNKRLLLLPDFRADAESNKGLQFVLNVVGGDPVQIEAKHKSATTAVLNTWVMFHSNQLPNFRDPTNAAMRRIIPVHRKGSWEDRQDPALPAKLREELPGILNWSLMGLRRLTKRPKGDFDRGMFDKQLMENAARTTNPMMAFLQDACTIAIDDDTAWVSIEELHNAWCHWTNDTLTRNNLNREAFATAIKQSEARLKSEVRAGKRGYKFIKVGK